MLRVPSRNELRLLEMHKRKKEPMKTRPTHPGTARGLANVEEAEWLYDEWDYGYLSVCRILGYTVTEKRRSSRFAGQTIAGGVQSSLDKLLDRHDRRDLLAKLKARDAGLPRTVAA